MVASRIVSLVPSATEIVFRLGAGSALVGRSHVCDFPPEAQSRPVLTRPNLESTSSRGIHDELRARLSSGLAIYDVDLESLRRLAPTHLLVQDQCSVCALSPADLEIALAEWLGQKPDLVSVAPQQLRDVWQDIDTIGNAIGRSEEARDLRVVLAAELSAIVESIPDGSKRPTVACIEWIDPLMIAGHWIPELVRIAGGEPLLNTTGAASKTIDLATLIHAAPEFIIVQICGFDLHATERAWAAQSDLQAAFSRARRPSSHTARPAPRILLTDGDAFFNRPGPRLVESARILAEILHPGNAGSADRRSDFREWTPE